MLDEREGASLGASRPEAEMQASSNSPRLRRVAMIGAIVLCAMGLADVALICHALGGLRRGLAFCAHDPGKCLFHVVILPLAFAKLTSCFPDRAWAGFRRDRGRRLVAMAIAAAFVVGVTGLVWQDVTKERVPWPTDVRGLENRIALFEKQAALRDELHEVSAGETGEAAISPAAAYAEYEDLAKASLAPDGTFEFVSDASLRAWWAAWLSLVGALFAAYLVWVIVLFPLLGRLAPKGLTDAVGTVLVLASIWFVLRPYSEWYWSLYSGGLQGYQPFVPGVVAAGVGALLLYLPGEIRNGPGLPTKVMAGLGALATILAVTNPGVAGVVGRQVARTEGFALFLVYLLVLILFLAVGSSIFQRGVEAHEDP